MKNSRLFAAAVLVVASPLSAITPPATGSISRHLWTGVGGTEIPLLTSLGSYPVDPGTATTDTDFHAPSGIDDNYGTRMFGWVHAPVTGDYTFWIHSDDNGELWLSSSESPDEKELVAKVPGWTNDGEWTKFPEQQSAIVTLEAGRFYFIEGLHKEGTGGDNLGVAWQYPGQARTYIPGSALSPWQNLPPDAIADAVTVGVGGIVAVPVLANDLEANGDADLDLASLAVTSGPSDGTIAVDTVNGFITYTHTGSTPGADSFTYRIRDAAGLEDTATVSLTISDAARLPATTITLPPEAPPTDLLVEDAFGLTFASPVKAASAPGNTQRLWVCEKGGDLELIPDVTAATPSKTLFLNVDAIVNGRPGEVFLTGSEQGLLSVAFHPQYQSNGHFFTVYSVSVNGFAYQRLSRWHDPNRSDTVAEDASEEVLIQMRNEAGNHNGGDLAFDADGYLYMSWGDEGMQHDQKNNSQRLDNDFWSSVIRLDVDLEAEDYTPQDGTGSDDDSVPPNAHPAIVLHSDNPLYEVPADNPWVGATSFNGGALVAASVRSEFFAVGFRNPWRFSFDPLTDDLWLADVGQGSREEVAIIESGSNHGWAWREGDNPGSKSGQVINGTVEANATLTDPRWDYGHGSGTYQGNSVTGGVVYRGDTVPQLYGMYIFADYTSGNIWTLDPDVSNPSAGNGVERIAGEGNIVAFAHDPSNGEVLIVDYDGPIHRLTASSAADGFPPTLAATGLFADLSDPLNPVPNPGVVAYDINLPFWSDRARKQRWFAIENTSDQFGYDRDGVWSFPTGAIWVKHFTLETVAGNPASEKAIETRIIVKTDTSAYGVTYRWNDPATEATLVPDAGEDRAIAVSDPVPRMQTWRYPSRSECLTCHNPVGGRALSFNTRQLNRDGTLGGSSGNLLSLLASTTYLDLFTDDPATLARHLAPDESDYSLEARVRSYLAVNCAYCHQLPGTAGDSWDGRAHLPLSATKVVNGPMTAALDPSDRLVVPGDPMHSGILSRVAVTNGYTRMPPVGSNELDQAAITLLTDWINSAGLVAHQTYDEWRLATFGNLTSAEGEPGANPDLDANDNHTEWVTRTDPLDGSDYWSPTVNTDGPGVTVDATLGNRSVVIEHSLDLETWMRWDHPDNHGIPLAEGLPNLFSFLPGETAEFFRGVVEEN